MRHRIKTFLHLKWMCLDDSNKQCLSVWQSFFYFWAFPSECQLHCSTLQKTTMTVLVTCLVFVVFFNFCKKLNDSGGWLKTTMITTVKGTNLFIQKSGFALNLKCITFRALRCSYDFVSLLDWVLPVMNQWPSDLKKKKTEHKLWILTFNFL